MSPIALLQQTVSTACEQGMMCVHDRPGHNLGAIQLRLATVAASGWVDAVVRSVGDDGWLELERWTDGSSITAWHHTPLEGRLVPGSIVAVHDRYAVLASGTERLNVAFG